MRKTNKHILVKIRNKTHHTLGDYVAYRPHYELRKIRWEINPYDSDKNPRWSIPHGDDIYPRYHTLKLNVYTGDIYTSKNHEYKGKLTEKELDRLHNDPKFETVVNEALKFRNDNKKQIVSCKSLYSVELNCYMIAKGR